MRVVATGMSARCARAATSIAAPEAITPPPAYITGRFASFRSFARRAIWEAVAALSGWYALSDTRSGYCASVSPCWQFFGMSITTGPGFPCVAM